VSEANLKAVDVGMVPLGHPSRQRSFGYATLIQGSDVLDPSCGELENLDMHIKKGASAGVVLCVFSLVGVAQSPNPNDWRKQLKSPTSLSTIRRMFLNQKVIVTGTVVTLKGSVLLDWCVAYKGTGDRYTKDTMDYLSSAYRGTTATVVAVQLNELKLRDLRPNALGEIGAGDNISGPYFDIVVQFDDGTLAILTGYPGSIFDDIELASAASALTERIAKELPLLIGKTVYAVGYSKLYQPDTSLEELVGDDRKGVLNHLWPSDIPLLQPMTILAAKYIDSAGVVFKLKLPNGKEALSFTSTHDCREGDSDRPFRERVIGTLKMEMPKKLTQREIYAIKKGTIYKGMTEDALDYMLGFNDKENDWGRGGRQLVYHDGSLLVYLDRNNRVEDWQSFDK
jgi:hypothetical protein